MLCIGSVKHLGNTVLPLMVVISFAIGNDAGARDVSVLLVTAVVCSTWAVIVGGTHLP